jgi:YesN/AraC family two-component response regulator
MTPPAQVKRPPAAPPEFFSPQVAERVGFSDPFHCSRAFKSVFGLSPDAFRRLR